MCSAGTTGGDEEKRLARPPQPHLPVSGDRFQPAPSPAGMPPRRVRNKGNPAAVAPSSGCDHLSELPEDVLEHVLSFLPAQDAVRTCVLARRWRHIWKSAHGLRILCGRDKEPASVEELREFVDNLLRIRRGRDSPIDTCEFRLLQLDVDDIPRINVWIRQALECKVRILRLHIRQDYYDPPYSELDDLPLISKHLKKLELEGVDLAGNRFLDFSSCPVLEDLILRCNLVNAEALSSRSLTSLRIDGTNFPEDYRMEIYAPNLVSFWLQVADGWTPWLEGMPSLVTAVVEINSGHSADICYGSVSSWDCDDPDCDCDYVDDDNNKCILLQSLSEAQNLVLKARDIQKFIFRRDLRFCPTFNNLKTLLLNEYWCEPADFSALARLLEHSPVLEKLTLQLYSKGPKHKLEIKLICKPMDNSAAVSEHLQTVEINCQMFDETVHNALKFLGDLNIWFQFDGMKCSA